MIVGITRFSVLSAKGWSLSRAENPSGALFAPDRLAAHFGLFEAITLPFMKAEPSIFLILISSLLPEPWLGRLQNDVKDAPNIHIREVAPDVSMTVVLQEFLVQLRGEDPTDKFIVTFRIDDDDCLAAGRTRALVKYRKSGAKIITHRSGLYVRWNGGLECAEVDYESNAQGIAYVSRKTSRHISLYGGHTKWTRKYDTLILNERTSWLRTIHNASDSSFRDHPAKWKPLKGARLRLFAERFPFIDLARVSSALEMASKVPPAPLRPKKEKAVRNKPISKA
jgi:Putative rhamnosyl transferase